VLIRKIGYSAYEGTVQFAANAPTSRQFQLFKTATLDTVSVIADRRMADFEEHRRLGLGHFLTRAELEKLEGVRLQSVLSEMPGAGILPGRGTHAWLVRGFRGVRPTQDCIPIDQVVDGWKGARPCQCYARVYLDQMLVYSAQPPAGGAGGIPVPLFDLNEISVSQIEAIEYYANEMEMPAKYLSSYARCSVLVIHTRRDYKRK
jgi:hypothetical protein